MQLELFYLNVPVYHNEKVLRDDFYFKGIQECYGLVPDLVLFNGCRHGDTLCDDSIEDRLNIEEYKRLLE